MVNQEIKISSWRMFWNFFRVSSLTLGGGYSMLFVLEKFYVKEQKLMSPQEWDDSIIIAQASPGAFALNLAFLIGYNINGYWGSFIALIGMTIPSFLAMLAVGTIVIHFLHYEMAKSFLVGVATGPISYYTYTFLKMFKGILGKWVIIIPFLVFTVLQLIFKVSINYIILMVFLFIFIQYVHSLKKNKKGEE